MRPDRYDNVPAPDREALSLPNGNRIAVWIAPNVEFYEYVPPPGQYPYRDPWPRAPHPDVLTYGWRDYGNRVAVWRMFDLLDEFAVRGTVSLNVAVFDHFPKIAEEMAKRDWDYMSHGIYNTRYAWDMTEAQECELITDVIDTVRRHTGKMIGGWLGPGLTTTHNTPDLLAEAGVKYWADYFHDDEPGPIRVRSGRLISIPYAIEINDAVAIAFHRHSAETFARMIKEQFDQLYAEGSTSGRVMCIATHPYLIDTPSRQKYFRDALEYVFGHSGVWNTTGTEIADWYYAAYYADALGRKAVGT